MKINWSTHQIELIPWHRHYNLFMRDYNLGLESFCFYAETQLFDMNVLYAFSDEFIFLSGGFNLSAKKWDGYYPQDARLCFFALDPETCWKQTLSYENCKEFGFDVYNQKRNLKQLVPTIPIGGGGEYSLIKPHVDRQNKYFGDWRYHQYIKENPPTQIYTSSDNEWRDRVDAVWRGFVPYHEHMHRYNQYINHSPVWASKRRAVFMRDNQQCRNCSSHTHLQCHHITYDRLYYEDLEDLMTFCRTCHNMEHKGLRFEFWLRSQMNIRL